MTWTEIGSTTLGSAAASISINVPTPYDFYRVTMFGIRTLSGINTIIGIRLNGDSGANYAFQQVAANSTTITGARSTSQTSVGLTDSNGWDASQGLTAMFTALIAKPAAGVKAQTIGQSNYPAGNPANTTGELNLIGGEWNNTADEVTSVAVVSSSGNFAAGTTVLLEGMNA